MFNGDKRGLSFGLCTDGVNPYAHNRVSYSMSPIVLTLLNFPRSMRNSFTNLFLVGIIPGNGSKEAAHIDPYLNVLVDEMLPLTTSVFYDAYSKAPFDLKGRVLSYVLDHDCIQQTVPDAMHTVDDVVHVFNLMTGKRIAVRYRQLRGKLAISL